MNAEIKAEWLKRLKSGQYIKGRKMLKEVLTTNESRHCCLGVLCEIYAEQNTAEWKPMMHTTLGKCQKIVINSDDDTTASAVLPDNIVKWSGLEDNNPEIKHDNGSSIAELNDNTPTFEEVIKVIEEQL